jgi:hypothetical protein
MSMAPSTASSLTPGPSPLDVVIAFFQSVFSGTTDESPEHKAAIRALIDGAFGPGYTFNGGKMAPKDLAAWREFQVAKFSRMTFRVNNALSWPVDAGTIEPTTAVSISWTVNATDGEGYQFQLNGMNMLGMQAGKATSNVQLGDAEKGWRRIS